MSRILIVEDEKKIARFWNWNYPTKATKLTPLMMAEPALKKRLAGSPT